MEVIKDYECTIAYHPRKANEVAGALRRMNSNKESKGSIALLKELKACTTIFNARLVENLITRFQVKPTLEEEIVETQPADLVLRKLTEEVICDK